MSQAVKAAGSIVLLPAVSGGAVSGILRPRVTEG